MMSSLDRQRIATTRMTTRGSWPGASPSTRSHQIFYCGQRITTTRMSIRGSWPGASPSTRSHQISKSRAKDSHHKDVYPRVLARSKLTQPGRTRFKKHGQRIATTRMSTRGSWQGASSVNQVAPGCFSDYGGRTYLCHADQGPATSLTEIP